MERLILHIDVNSAYLSWTAVDLLEKGETVDLREIPAIIGGDIASRHGIVLAKSLPAKAYGIRTGEPVSHARSKCPSLTSVPPDRTLYARRSRELMELLGTFCPCIEQVSIDECFMDFTEYQTRYDSPIAAASLIKDTIYHTFGFTVNIGISTNKLLAKMASDFEKPNKVHTLFPQEIRTKMWPLPVSELYMVGKSSAAALKKLDIHTIGDLALMDRQIVTSHMKSHGQLIWEYANGIDNTPVLTEAADAKCVGNSTTLPRDLTTRQEALPILLSLSSQVAGRLKRHGLLAKMVSVELKYATFVKVSHQMQLPQATCDGKKLYEAACRLFDELWSREPIRLLGVRTSKLAEAEEPVQMNLFELPRTQKEIRADRTLEALQERFGQHVIKKGW